MTWTDNFTLCLVLSTAFSTFGSSFLFGYNMGVLNTPASIIKQFYCDAYNNRSSTREPISDGTIDFLWALTVSIYVGVGMIGACCTAAVADRFGRKGGLIFNQSFMLIGSLIEGLSKLCASPEMVIIGRGFIGFNCGLTVGMVSLYLTEISSKEVRGAIGSCHSLLTTMGIFLAQVFGLEQLLGTEEGWPVLLAISGIPAIVSLIALPFFPESPRYLLLKKCDKEAAIKALQRLRGKENVQDEIDEMEEEARGAKHLGKFTIAQLFKSSELRLPLAITIIIQITQQWSGINCIFFYSQSTFGKAGVAADNIPYAVMGTGAINVLVAIISIPMVEKFGRRPLLLIPLVVMAVSCVMVTISINLQDDHRWLANVTITFIIIYIIGFSSGLGPIPAFVASELFRQEPRPAAMTIAQVVNWTSNFILAMCFIFIQDALGAYTFLIFAVIIVASVIFIFFFVPETKNRTFDDIAQHLALARPGQRPTTVLLGPINGNETNNDNAQDSQI